VPLSLTKTLSDNVPRSLTWGEIVGCDLRSGGGRPEFRNRASSGRGAGVVRTITIAPTGRRAGRGSIRRIAGSIRLSVCGGESIRDYWRRRTEESKERVSRGSTTSSVGGEDTLGSGGRSLTSGGTTATPSGKIVISNMPSLLEGQLFR